MTSETAPEITFDSVAPGNQEVYGVRWHIEGIEAF
jgi:hypothetical protein